MLYIFDEVNKLGDNFHIRCAHCLSQERIEKLSRLRSVSGKALSAAVYLLLRYALAARYGIDESVGFEYGKNGKPRLRDFPDMHFNLSHTANAVACAVSDSPIGVDVQRIAEVSEKVARRVLTEIEYQEFLRDDNPDDYFCRAWTMKESVLKQTGQGIAGDFRDISVADLTDITVYRGDGYYCSVTEADAVIEKVSFLCLCGAGSQGIRESDFSMLY